MNTAFEAILALLTARGVAYTIHEHIAFYTVADAGERLPFPAERLLKTVVSQMIYHENAWRLGATR